MGKTFRPSDRRSRSDRAAIRAAKRASNRQMRRIDWLDTTDPHPSRNNSK